MKVGSYSVFETVDNENSVVILSQMRDRLSEDLHSWKKTSGMYLLMKNQIDALDIALERLKEGAEVELKFELPKEKLDEAVNNVMNKVRSDTGMSLKECYEKQIPKKPVIFYEQTHDCVTEVEWECPICGTNYIELAPCGEWCRYCGQKLDWSE